MQKSIYYNNKFNKSRNKSKKFRRSRRSKYRNSDILDELHFAGYKTVKERVEKVTGKMPKRPSDLPDGNWSEQAVKVLTERYLQRDDNGEIYETPEDMAWRVAWEISSADALWGKDREEIFNQAKSFYNLLVSRKFLPNSPTLMNAGTGNMLQFSACFVLPVEDSMGGIFDSLKYQALIHKSGGGTGFSFTRLRPKGSMVKSSSGTASGPVSFMRIFDAATNEVKQGGKRRGANMGILRVDHPDIMEFIHCKEDGGITNFNISVALTDKFMDAYKNDTDYDLVDPNTKKIVGQLNAKKVFDEIADGAWRTGDPGLIFIDKINNGPANPVPVLGPIESTNPCGEQPLYPFDSCNLGSIFLSYFVKDDGFGEKIIDWDELREVTAQSVRFMDNVIEMNPYPLDPIKKTSLGIRRIGLGVGGWADMLIELGIAYDSDEALQLGEKVMSTIQEEAVIATQDLAKERGPFPLFDKSIYKDEKPRRNSTVTTIAPTGTISIIAGTSSGIEPIFAIAYQHIVKDKHLDRTLTFVNPKFKQLAEAQGIWNEQLEEKVAEHGTVRDIDEVPQDLKDIFGTAHEIHHDWHIKMQGAFQRGTENAVSKTINMRNEVSADDIKEAYLLAWENECKGITVFRDGCKDAQVLNMGVKKEGETQEVDDDKAAIDHPPLEPTLHRSFRTIGATYKLNTPSGTAFVTINENEFGDPIEVFINVGKAGSDITAVAEALGRTVSTALRFHSNLSPKDKAREIALQLSGIGGRRSVGFGPTKILSLPDAVAAAISLHLGFDINGYQKMSNQLGITPFGDNELKTNGHATEEVKIEFSEKEEIKNGIGTHTESLQLTLQKSPSSKADICPSCGATALVFEEGCSKCHACGHSEC